MKGKSFFMMNTVEKFHIYSFIISHEYNPFFKKQLMNFSDGLNLYEEENFFLNSINVRAEESIDVLEPSTWPDLSYHHRADSMIYISQFLSLIDEEPTTATKQHQEVASGQNNGIGNEKLFQHQKVDFTNKQKKIKKLENSPFHNYQKHLNNALKKMIIVPAFQETEDLFKKVARELWIKYLLSDIKTKKILHSVFNERNEHQSSETELRLYGFWEIYEAYGEKTFNQAKNYLSRLAIDQIDEANIEGYLRTRKLKKVEGFKEYILRFRQELCNGYLKRRINLDQNQN